MPFPDEHLVYDYRLDDGGVSKSSADDEEEEDKKKTKVLIVFLTPHMPGFHQGGHVHGEAPPLKVLNLVPKVLGGGGTPHPPPQGKYRR